MSDPEMPERGGGKPNDEKMEAFLGGASIDVPFPSEEELNEAEESAAAASREGIQEARSDLESAVIPENVERFGKEIEGTIRLYLLDVKRMETQMLLRTELPKDPPSRWEALWDKVKGYFSPKLRVRIKSR